MRFLKVIIILLIYPTIVFGECFVEKCFNLTDIIPAIYDTDSLTCINCNISILHRYTLQFNGFFLNLSRSHVKIIEDGVFIDSNIRTFYLDHNEISQLPLKLFEENKLVYVLDLHQNKISTVHDMFSNTSIEILDFSYNKIQDLNSAFSNLKIGHLNLSHNRIGVIPNNTFKLTTTDSESTISLSNNQITKIFPNSFVTNGILGTLDLSSNQLSNIENNIFKNANLLTLLLENNNISKLQANSFKGLIQLIHLKLRRNKLETIPLGLFADLQNLQLLDLSDNNFKQFNSNHFSGLISLTSFNFSKNQISTIGPYDLFPLAKLERFDASNNKLTDLNLTTIMEHHLHLKKVSLENNFWPCNTLFRICKKLTKHNIIYTTTSKYFNVSNLHGIACNSLKLQYSLKIEFEDFIKLLTQELDLKVETHTKNEEIKPEENILENILNLLDKLLSCLVIIILILVLYYSVKLARWFVSLFIIRSYPTSRRNRNIFYNLMTPMNSENSTNIDC